MPPFICSTPSSSSSRAGRGSGLGSATKSTWTLGKNSIKKISLLLRGEGYIKRGLSQKLAKYFLFVCFLHFWCYLLEHIHKRDVYILYTHINRRVFATHYNIIISVYPDPYHWPGSAPGNVDLDPGTKKIVINSHTNQPKL